MLLVEVWGPAPRGWGLAGHEAVCVWPGGCCGDPALLWAGRDRVALAESRAVGAQAQDGAVLGGMLPSSLGLTARRKMKPGGQESLR